MEIINIQISTGNAAFDNWPASEIGRILHDLAEKNTQGYDFDGIPLRDINGKNYYIKEA